MRRTSILVWSLAVLLTLASAVWQRRSGPSYPARGSVELAGETIPFRLARSHVTGTPQPVEIAGVPEGVEGAIEWRRHPTRDAWTTTPLGRSGDRLTGELPSQPPAGKLEYRVRLRAAGGADTELTAEPVVTRFRGDVPAWVLVPHIFAMFFGMMFSNAAGIGALARSEAAWRNGLVGLVLMSIGGLFLGPVVQKFAFDAWWTGFPFGTDLTDNKTAIALLAWAIALVATRRRRSGRGWLVAAALVTLVVFAIPHSLFGSELRWEDVPAPVAP